MYKKRLFERISDLEFQNDVSCTENMQIDSIINYLKSILSCRKGTTKMNEYFGMDNIYNSYNESFEDFILSSESEIQSEIQRLEPRLENIVVSYEGKDYNNLFYKFKIEAKLSENHAKKIVLNTIVSSKGRIEIDE
jgi:type VI secretion system lysozyme-like protein